MTRNRLTALRALAGTLAAAGIACTALAAEPFKVGFVYLTPIGEAGWTYAHDQGRLALEKALGNQVKTTYIENVPDGVEAEKALRQLSQDGNKVIIATTFGYMNPLIKVAKQYPKTVYLHATGFRTDDNIGTFDVRTYEGAYLAGVAAGMTTKTGKLGVVGSIITPEVIRNINAFTLGARSTHPNATVRVIWVNAWYNPPKERQAAESLIGQGADVLMQNTDSPAVVQVAQERKVRAFGWDSDMSRYGPDAHVAAAQINWGVYYAQAVREAMAGKWHSEPVWWGLKEGMIDLTAFNKNLPESVRRKVQERKQAIIAGRLAVFRGPLRDRTGHTVLPDGWTMDDEQLHRMNFYVEGVEGVPST